MGNLLLNVYDFRDIFKEVLNFNVYVLCCLE